MASPLLLDSTNAATLALVERYRTRYGRVPPWEAVQGYATTRLAIAAPTEGALDLQRRHEAVRAYLASLNSPIRAVAGVTGPLWFTPERGRLQAVRVAASTARYSSPPRCSLCR